VEQVGMLDTDFDPIYSEEVDYCLRTNEINSGIFGVQDFSTPYSLNSPADPSGWGPIMISDRQGRIHVFWTAWLDPYPEPKGGFGDTVMYRRLENDNWTMANDILAASGDRIILNDIEIDDQDNLILLWFDTDIRTLILCKSSSPILLMIARSVTISPALQDDGVKSKSVEYALRVCF